MAKNNFWIIWDLGGGENREGVEEEGVKSNTMDEESDGKVLQKTEVSKQGGYIVMSGATGSRLRKIIGLHG